MVTKDFHLSYAGEVEYDIRRDGRMVGRVSARYFGDPSMGWNGDYFETGIKTTIGTVRWDSSSMWHEFPPADIVALFPGFVGARLVFHPRTPDLDHTDVDYELPEMEVQYDGPAPVLCPDKNVSCHITAVGVNY